MKDFYQELSEYTGRNLNLVYERCQTARVELAWLWEQYKNDPIAYYRDSDLYIFDLSFYCQLIQDSGFYQQYEKILKDFQIKTCLDFGGGIGEYAIIACNNGIKTDYLEIEESKTLEYAKYRFKQYGVEPTILGLNDEIGKYDLIVAMDVFEHILDNKPVIEKCAQSCKYMICNTPEELPYNFIYPQHISKLNLNPYFDLIEGRLWKSKIKI